MTGRAGVLKKAMHTRQCIVRDETLRDGIVTLSDMLNRNEHAAVDLALRTSDVEHMNITMMLMVLRTAHAARGALREYDGLLRRCRDETRRRGRDPDRVFRGL